MTKLLITLTALTLVAFGNVKQVYAENNLTLTCSGSDPGNCVLTGGSVSDMFHEEDMLPGDTFAQTLTVVNQKDDVCFLEMATTNETQNPADFAFKLFTVIKKLSPSDFDVYGIRDGSTKATSAKSLGTLFGETSVDLGTIPAFSSNSFFEWVVTFDPAAGNTYQQAETVFDFDLIFQCDENNTINDDPGDGPGDNNSGDGGTPPEGDVQGTSTFFAPFEDFFGEVAGEATESTETPAVAGIFTPQVAGTAGVCIDPWWWWLVFLMQIGAMFLISRISKGKDALHYIAQIIFGLVFFFIFWKWFCPWWDWILSLILSLILMLATREKDKKTNNSSYSTSTTTTSY